MSVPPIKFPFPYTPYEIQKQFMQKLYETIENKQLGIFESPTGTGKSLSIICGVLKWLQDHNDSEVQILQDQVVYLQTKMNSYPFDSPDWIGTQSKINELKNKSFEALSQLGLIREYNAKFEEIVQRRSKAKDKIKAHSSLVVQEDNFEEDALILEENTNTVLLEEEQQEEQAAYQPTKIFICSRTHSQLSQLVKEILKSPFGDKTRVATLASRQNYCLNATVKKLGNNSLINERCLDLKKASKTTLKDGEGQTTKKAKKSCSCPYYRQKGIEDLYEKILVKVQDMEDLMKNGQDSLGCPYYASRKAAEDAQIVLVPYNTLLHKATRQANGIKLKDSVVIIDEAHNLLEALAQMYSAVVTLEQLTSSLEQLTSYKNKYNKRLSASNLLNLNQLIFVVSKLQHFLSQNNTSQIFILENFVSSCQIDNYNMFRLVEFCNTSRLAQKLRGFASQKLDGTTSGVKSFLETLSSKPAKQATTSQAFTLPQKTTLLPVISFLESLTNSTEDGRILLQNNSLKFLLLDPSSNFCEIVQQARSVIVAGGTMKPVEEFRNRLFLKSGASPYRIIHFTCDHIISPNNILPIVMTKCHDKKLIFRYENREALLPVLKQILHETCKTIPGGIVVFFPSYSFEKTFFELIKNDNFDRKVFREPAKSSEVEEVLNNYSKTIKKTNKALMLSVVGGKLSEGLNFSDNLGRCIVVVGMPYANNNALDFKEKIAFLERKEGPEAGHIFYNNSCMKAVNQCIGRAVRHKDDYATVLLLDSRYERSTTQNLLPHWIKRSLKTCDFQETFQLFQRFFAVRSTET